MSGLLKFGIVASLAVGGLIVIVSAVRTKRFFSCVFLSALQGVAAIFAVNALGLVTGLHLPLNTATILSSVIGGTPAVIGLVIMEIIMKI